MFYQVIFILLETSFDNQGYSDHCTADTSLWCLTVSLSLSHWCPGSGVVLDCMTFAPLLTLTLYFLCELLSVINQICTYKLSYKRVVLRASVYFWYLLILFRTLIRHHQRILDIFIFSALSKKDGCES